jgi:hypothetical protein
MKLFIIYFIIGAVISINIPNELYASPTDPVDSFALKYKKAKTEIQKRTVAIELIDAGLLYSESPIDDIKKVFQNDFEEQGADGHGHKLAIVRFVHPKRPSNPIAAAEITGWFLSLTYREDGTIVHYYLSNESKTTSMRLRYERKMKEQHEADTYTGLPTLKDATNINSSVNTNK